MTTEKIRMPELNKLDTIKDHKGSTFRVMNVTGDDITIVPISSEGKEIGERFIFSKKMYQAGLTEYRRLNLPTVTIKKLNERKEQEVEQFKVKASGESTRDKVRAMIQAGKNIPDIAQEIGVQAQTVKYHIEKIKEEDEGMETEMSEKDTGQEEFGEVFKEAVEEVETQPRIKTKHAYLIKIDLIIGMIEDGSEETIEAASTLCGRILLDGIREEFRGTKEVQG
ncbi:MAG: hypothetical protein VB031_02295 [Eubacteriaceae bacterium]|nr:hypothetical protein [Eubacteriaceae bacterium]